jgi:hypothetical protein
MLSQAISSFGQKPKFQMPTTQSWGDMMAAKVMASADPANRGFIPNEISYMFDGMEKVIDIGGGREPSPADVREIAKHLIGKYPQLGKAKQMTYKLGRHSVYRSLPNPPAKYREPKETDNPEQFLKDAFWKNYGNDKNVGEAQKFWLDIVRATRADWKEANAFRQKLNSGKAPDPETTAGDKAAAAFGAWVRTRGGAALDQIPAAIENAAEFLGEPLKLQNAESIHRQGVMAAMAKARYYGRLARTFQELASKGGPPEAGKYALHMAKQTKRALDIVSEQLASMNENVAAQQIRSMDLSQFLTKAATMPFSSAMAYGTGQTLEDALERVGGAGRFFSNIGDFAVQYAVGGGASALGAKAVAGAGKALTAAGAGAKASVLTKPLMVAGKAMSTPAASGAGRLIGRELMGGLPMMGAMAATDVPEMGVLDAANRHLNPMSQWNAEGVTGWDRATMALTTALLAAGMVKGGRMITEFAPFEKAKLAKLVPGTKGVSIAPDIVHDMIRLHDMAKAGKKLPDGTLLTPDLVLKSIDSYVKDQAAGVQSPSKVAPASYPGKPPVQQDLRNVSRGTSLTDLEQLVKVAAQETPMPQQDPRTTPVGQAVAAGAERQGLDVYIGDTWKQTTRDFVAELRQTAGKSQTPEAMAQRRLANTLERSIRDGQPHKYVVDVLTEEFGAPGKVGGVETVADPFPQAKPQTWSQADGTPIKLDMPEPIKFTQEHADVWNTIPGVKGALKPDGTIELTMKGGGKITVVPEATALAIDPESFKAEHGYYPESVDVGVAAFVWSGQAGNPGKVAAAIRQLIVETGKHKDVAERVDLVEELVHAADKLGAFGDQTWSSVMKAFGTEAKAVEFFKNYLLRNEKKPGSWMEKLKTWALNVWDAGKAFANTGSFKRAGQVMGAAKNLTTGKLWDRFNTDYTATTKEALGGQKRYSTKQAGPDEELRLLHVSRTPGVEVVSPKYQTGSKGSEKSYVGQQGAVPHTYWYTEGSRSDMNVQGDSAYVSKQTVKRSQLYDVLEDPQGFGADAKPGDKANAIMRGAKAAGFKGLFNTDRKHAVLFDDMPVQPAKNPRGEGMNFKPQEGREWDFTRDVRYSTRKLSPDDMKQRGETAPMFFSQLERAIDKLPARGTPEQMYKTLIGQGVKPDEMKFAGVLQELGITIENGQPVFAWRSPVEKSSITAAINRRMDTLSYEDRTGAETRYSKYASNASRPSGLYDGESGYTERLFHLKDSSDTYEAPHWQGGGLNENLIAHTRFDDKKGPSGERVLHAAELQSDWHQAGRTKGYASKQKIDEAKNRISELQDEAQKYYDASYDANVAHDEAVRLRDQLSYIESLIERGDGAMGAGWHREQGAQRIKEFQKSIDDTEKAGQSIKDQGIELPKGAYDFVQSNIKGSRAEIERWNQSLALLDKYENDRPGLKEAIKDAERKIDEAFSDYHDYGRRSQRAAQAAEDEENNLYLLRKNPPEAPNSKTWHELLFKSLLRTAAEKGKDRLSWDTGSTQGKRYRLSNEVEWITYNPESNTLTYKPTNGAGHQALTNVTPEKLPDYIGQDAAKGLLSGRRDPSTGDLILEGEGLNIESTGMTGFYDKILVDFANKYVKKWGSRVEDITLDDGTPAHSVKITPEMSDSVLYEGQARYATHRHSQPYPKVDKPQRMPANSDDVPGIRNFTAAAKQEAFDYMQREGITVNAKMTVGQIEKMYMDMFGDGVTSKILADHADTDSLTPEQIVMSGFMLKPMFEKITDLRAQLAAEEAKGLGLDTREMKILQMAIEDYSGQYDKLVRGFTKGSSNLGQAMRMLQEIRFGSVDASNFIAQTSKQSGRSMTDADKARVSDLVERAKKGDMDAARELKGIRDSYLADGLLATIAAVWRAGLLTSPTTTIVNLKGNVLGAAVDEVARIPAFVADWLVSGLTGKRTVDANPFTSIEAAIRSFKPSFKKMGQIAVLGATPEDMARLEGMRELRSSLPFGIGTTANVYANSVFRYMSMQDRGFREYAFNRSLLEQSKLMARGDKAKVKDLFQNPTEEMTYIAMLQAEEAVFANSNLVSQGTSYIRNTAKLKSGDAIPFVMDIVMPFTKIPTNMVGRSLDLTPLGFLNSFAKTVTSGVKHGRKNIPYEVQRAFAMSIGRGVTGPGLFALGWALAKAGMARGFRGSPAENETNETMGVTTPSATVDGTSYSLATDSFSMIVAAGATAFEKAQKQDSFVPRMFASAFGGVKNIIEEVPVFSGVKDIQKMFEAEDPLEGISTYGKQKYASIIPSLLAAWAQAKSPAKTAKVSQLTKEEALKANWPWSRQDVPKEADALGEDIETGYSRLNPLWRSIYAPKQRTEMEKDPDKLRVYETLRKLGWGESSVKAEFPGQTVKDAGRELLTLTGPKPITATPEERAFGLDVNEKSAADIQAHRRFSGQFVMEVLKIVTKKAEQVDAYKNGGTAVQRMVIRDAIKDSRSKAEAIWKGLAKAQRLGGIDKAEAQSVADEIIQKLRDFKSDN